MVIVWIIFWDWLELRTVLSVHVWALVRVGSWYRVARVYVVKCHVSLLLIRVGDGAVHSFDWQLRIKLSALCWSLRTPHHILVVLIHHHLMPRAVAGHGRCLHGAYPMSPLHHLVEYLLFGWVRVCLVLIAYRCPTPRVISNAKKICPRIKSSIGFWMILITISCRHASRVFLFWLHRSHLLDVETRWLSWLAWDGMVLKFVGSDVGTSMSFFWLIASIIIQQRHMFSKWLLVIYVGVWAAEVFLGAHISFTIKSMLVRRFVWFSILFFVGEELGP